MNVPDADDLHLRELARLRRVRDRMDREYARPLDVEALARGVLPGIRGLEEPEAGLPLTAAHAAARPLEGASIGLVHAVGLDGHHASLVLARAEE